MIEKLYYVFIAALILFVIFSIITNQMKKTKRKNKVIIKLKRGIGFHAIAGLSWLIFFILFSYIFIDRAQEVYYSLDKEYIDSVYQLFDLEYLKSLRQYFYENNMLIELHSTAFYQGELLNMLTWIIGSFCIFLLNFYMAWQPDEILESGIVVSGKLFNYDKISGYRRGNLHEKKLMGKEIKYYDYFISLKMTKPLSKLITENETRLYVSYGSEDLVDSNLEKLMEKKE